MNINHLNYFVMAVDHGSYSAAARRADVTQPTISSAIKSLENEFGSCLVLPTKEGLELTDAGRSLLESSRTLLGDAERIRENMQRMKDMESGKISIGIREHLMTNTIHELLDRFTSENPKIHIRIRTGDYYRLRKMLLGAEVDFVIDHTGSSKSPEDVDTELLMEDRLMIFMRPGHPECHKQGLPMEIVQEYPTLYSSDLFHQARHSSNRLRDVFTAAPPAIDIDNINLIANIVANSDKDYVFVWTYQLFETWLKQGKLVAVPVAGDNWYRPGESWSLPVKVSYRSKRLLSPVAKKFIDELRKECQQFATPDNKSKRERSQAAAAAAEAS